MGYDTGIASRLRAAGIPVVEVSGWQSRGSSSFTPKGAVNHHTAGPSSGATPSLNTCIYGRPDLAGPLCNVMQSREPGGYDIAYVIAAGRANHAGEGGWRGLTGTSSVYGLEIEHTGTSALPQGRIDTAAAICAAMFTGDVGMICQHAEWAQPPGRKIDAATNVPGDWFRELCKAARSSDGDWFDMATQAELETVVRRVLNEGTAKGQQNWAGTSKQQLALEQTNYNQLAALTSTVGAIADELGTPQAAAAEVVEVEVEPDPERE
jgi:hypothetical protein